MDEAKTYSEVLEVLNHLVKEDYDRIPKEYIDYFYNNSEKNYRFEYDSLKSFEDQQISDKAKMILFGLFTEFVADEKQKKKINKYLYDYNTKIDQEKQKLYNYNDLFGNESQEGHKENVEITTIEKQSFVDKIKKAIKNIFKKKK